MQDIYIGNGITEYHLHSLNQWLSTVVYRGLEGLDNPTMRTDVYNNPGIRGETVAQILAGGSLVSIEGAMRVQHTDNPAEVIAAYLQERQNLAAAISHTYNALGRVQPLTLRFTDLSGRALQVECFKDRYKAPFELPTRNEWFLQLRNPSGVIESQSQKTATVDLPKQGGVTFDLVWDIVFGDSSGGSATATNDGSTEARPVIRLYGPMTNPVLTNTATNEYIGLNHILLAGDVITIDTRHNSIIQGESTNRMGTRQAGSTLWNLQPGANTITLSADTYEAGYAEIDYRDTFEGL